MVKFGFLPLVFGSYEVFAPLYAYTLKRAYPDYWLRILFKTKPSPEVEKALKMVEGKVDWVENFAPFSIANDYKLNRWLVPYHLVKDFDFAYFGDIDILICKERKSILEQHLEITSKTGLPYSNVDRFSNKKGMHHHRLSGLHFIKTHEYYTLMGWIIEHFINCPEEVKIFEEEHSYSNDETFLYTLVAMANLTPESVPNLRPLHGLHLRALIQKHQKANKNIKKSVLSYYEDPLFNEVIAIMENKNGIGDIMEDIKLKLKEDL